MAAKGEGVNYYNEHDPKAAEWLRELIRAGHIPAGEVDTRDIRDVRATDLVQFTQCHFFAGIGGWSLALRLAGWPDDARVWTGSCPCQPFSTAGKQMGRADARHLWPAFRRLILHGAPPVVFGEQVASAAGREWLAGVRANLETMGYAVGAADLCAAGVGAPHIRQRLFWVAESQGERWGAGPVFHQGNQAWNSRPLHGSSLGRLADVQQPGLEGHAGHGDDGHEPGRLGTLAAGSIAEGGRPGGVDNSTGARCDGPLRDAEGDSREEARMRLSGAGRPEGFWSAYDLIPCAGGCGAGGMADAGSRGSETRLPEPEQWQEGIAKVVDHGGGGSGFWSAYDLIPCADGKARRIEPGTFPLAHGVSGRVGLLRGYGNAIVPQVAAEFIQAYLEAKGELNP